MPVGGRPDECHRTVSMRELREAAGPHSLTGQREYQLLCGQGREALKLLIIAD